MGTKRTDNLPLSGVNYVYATGGVRNQTIEEEPNIITLKDYIEQINKRVERIEKYLTKN